MRAVGYSRLDVIVQPDDGVQRVVDIIGRARKTILVKMFTFTSDALMQALIAAAFNLEAIGADKGAVAT